MTTNPEELFDSLVKNAIDFLNQSVIELLSTPSNPKYSVINFYSSVELFLKARLMAECWVLIYNEIGNADEIKFSKGNFSSVNFRDVITRLEKFAHVKISKEAYKSFDNLREHRNKLIHFFHPEYVQPDKKIIESIVIEQYKGWHHLYRLLAKDWKSTFSLYIGEFDKLNSSMLKLSSFLKTKYDSIFPEIKKDIERGAIYLICESCGYQSKTVISGKNPLVESVCKVCEVKEKFLTIPCSNCKNEIFIYELGEGVCEECENEIAIDILLDYFDKDKTLEQSRAFCSSCDNGEATVIQMSENKWLCLSCLEKYEDNQVDKCERCSELIAGDIADSLFFGCIMCKDGGGWDND